MSAEVVSFGSVLSADANVMLLHGYACAAADWVPVAELLTGVQLLVDFPGHGTRTHDRSVGFDALVAGTVSLLEQLPGPVILGGHSMGGMVAIALAAANPALVRAVILADAFPFLPAVVEVFGAAEDPEDPFGYGSVIDRETPPDVQRRVREGMAAGVVTAGKELHAELMALDLRPLLPTISVPALVMIGDRRGRPPLHVSDLVARLGLDGLADLRVELIPSHHFVTLEQPTRVARHIEELLLDQEATRKE